MDVLPALLPRLPMAAANKPLTARPFLKRGVESSPSQLIRFVLVYPDWWFVRLPCSILQPAAPLAKSIPKNVWYNV